MICYLDHCFTLFQVFDLVKIWHPILSILRYINVYILYSAREEIRGGHDRKGPGADTTLCEGNGEMGGNRGRGGG